jgi:hypothetical protein
VQKQVVDLKRQINATSSQDQFAKWAKLTRQHDAQLAKYEQLAGGLKITKEGFAQRATALRFIILIGLRFLPGMYFSKEPMFWLPKGWFPMYVEWILSFPKAPMGSISVTMWAMACAGAIHFIAVDLRGLGTSLIEFVRTQKSTDQTKVKVPAQGTKKEL